MWNDIPKMMLVDMNSFFASVEQQANPALRGRPLGVSPSAREGSCLIGTSREAKALGIKNGTPVYKARRICPEILVLESEPEKYREVNRQMNKIFLDYTDQIETYSIDESFMDFRESKLNLLKVAAEIKRRIRQEVGEWLTCSVGIGQNKFMCKLAADMQKPDGLTIVWRENLREIYKQKQFEDLWGINRGWTKRFENLGIYSPLKFLDYPLQNLISAFGKPGFYMWQRIHGLEDPGIDLGEENQKSFGNSWVLGFRTTNKEKLKIVILRLAEKAARRMRRYGYVASGIYLSVTLTDGRRFHRSKKMDFEISSGSQFYEEAMKIWEDWEFSEEVMHIAVGFIRIRPQVHQLSLWPEKFSNLIPTIDKINDRYGEFTIRSGLLTNTRDYAPDAIAFGR